MNKSKVYFTKDITSENMIKMYEALGNPLPGKVAVSSTPARWEIRISSVLPF